MKRQRLHIRIYGAVQGVGFRPFVYRLAREECLSGWVRNVPGGVELEAEGESCRVECFFHRLSSEKPPRALVFGCEPRWLEPQGAAWRGDRIVSDTCFEIRESVRDGSSLPPVLLPDLAVCPECVEELFSPDSRRYYYPFTNCTNCGPRYTIMEGVPYDRERTSMKGFPLCPECLEEYEDPGDRRFHAQPVSCPRCGPRLFLIDASGRTLREGLDAEATREMVGDAVRLLRSGNVLALMGMGGVQLVVDASDEEAVRMLRRRKAREAKPLAVMMPGLESVRDVAHVSAAEACLLLSPEGPIVLLERREPSGPESRIAPSVAAFSPLLGVMLPTTPLHHLICREMSGPLVVTSGNLSGEPMCTTRGEALTRLGGIADAFLLHDRPILRAMDDSVARIVQGREVILRRARGYAPLPVGPSLKPGAEERGILAWGGQMKNAVGWYSRGLFVPGPHVGDLEFVESLSACRQSATHLEMLLGSRADVIAVDAHPDYESSRLGREYARERGAPVVEVQHHVAHVLSCMAENEASFPLLGVAWDGTGYGTDGLIWGSEFFLMERDGWTRAAHLAPFALPGGEAAVREPRRIALSLLSRMEPDECPRLRELARGAFEEREERNCLKMISAGRHAPLTTSMGRLFDAVAFFLGFDGPVLCEGQAAMTLEAWAKKGRDGEECRDSGRLLFTGNPDGSGLDWRPLLRELDARLSTGAFREDLARLFHHALASLIVTIAEKTGMKGVAVGGGCFQNMLLLDCLLQRAGERGLSVFFPRRVPPNDGGLALGQLAAVLWNYREKQVK